MRGIFVGSHRPSGKLRVHFSEWSRWDSPVRRNQVRLRPVVPSGPGLEGAFGASALPFGGGGVVTFDVEPITRSELLPSPCRTGPPDSPQQRSRRPTVIIQWLLAVRSDDTTSYRGAGKPGRHHACVPRALEAIPMARPRRADREPRCARRQRGSVRDRPGTNLCLGTSPPDGRRRPGRRPRHQHR